MNPNNQQPLPQQNQKPKFVKQPKSLVILAFFNILAIWLIAFPLTRDHARASLNEISFENTLTTSLIGLLILLTLFGLAVIRNER